MSALAIALAVYAMVMQGDRVSVVLMASVVIVVAASSLLLVSRALRQLQQQQRATRRAARFAERHYFKVLRRIVAAVEAREEYTRGRSRRIGLLARQIGRQMNLDNQRCSLLALAAQVHDIGLLAVPDRVLQKPSTLGGDEFASIKRHSELSYRILQPLTFLSDILSAVRHHHERMNGTGYPSNLRGQEICLEARVLAVADAYDSMTHDRPHRRAVTSLRAMEELRRCCPAGFDEDVVLALETVLHMPRLQACRAPQLSAPKAARLPHTSHSNL